MNLDDEAIVAANVVQLQGRLRSLEAELLALKKDIDVKSKLLSCVQIPPLSPPHPLPPSSSSI